MEDYILIKKIINGDITAFDRLVRKYYKNVYIYCYKRFGKKEIAEDLTQEIFLKIIKTIYKYQKNGKFSNFIFTITINTCNDYYRKNKIQMDELDINLKDEQIDIEENLIKKSEKVYLLKMINTLPEIQRDAIILHYYNDIKIKQIAEIKNVPINTIKSRIKQGIDKLKKYIKRGE